MFLTTAFLSKEASVTFPGLLFAILFTQPRLETWKEKWKKIFLQVSPSLLCAGIYAGLRAGPLDFQNSFQFYDTQNVYTESVWVRLYTALAGLPKYVQLWAWPDWLQIDRAFPVYVDFFTAPVLMGFGLFLLSLLGVLRGKQNPLLAFASLWFWAYHSLHTGLLLPLNSFFLEHWMYIPSFSFALVSVYGADQMAKRLSSKFNTKILYGVVLLWTLLLGIRTHFQNEVWSTPISLYKHILTTSKEVARVHNNLGMAYSDRGDSQKAEEHYLKAIEINDIYPQVRHNLGLLYLRQGKIDLGIYQLKEALHIQPDFYPSFIYLSKAYEFQGNEKLKKFYEEKARKAQPQFSKPLTN
ncbi:MAG TPA: hypothetical protein DCL41_09135 [Bdellovibrionales bacterium]|nr:hypothetical protein [Bdellovibrionales bacterium]